MNVSRLVLDEICLLLETYKGRDKIIRTICYAAKLIGGIHKNEALAKKFLYVSSQLSGTRATLRLLDDLPLLQYTLDYGFGGDEPDPLMAHVGVVTNVIDTIYYPVEKMAWLAEHKLIAGGDNNVWDTASSVCWVASIYLTLLKTLRYLAMLQKHKKCPDGRISLGKIETMQKFEMLTTLRLMLDLVHAINTLPPGFLWSSKLQTWHIGLIGSLSSVLGIYQLFFKRKLT